MVEFGEIRSSAGTGDKDLFIENLLAALPPIYEKTNKDTILYRLYEALAKELVKADITLESIGNDNFVSVQVTNELQIRKFGTFDRLKNENAFHLNKIRFSPSGTISYQNTNLQVGENQVQLLFVPQVIDFQIFRANDPTRTPLDLPRTFDSLTNILTITCFESGSYTIGFQDSGDVVRIRSNLTVPPGLVRIGWGEGGYGEFGWGE